MINRCLDDLYIWRIIQISTAVYIGSNNFFIILWC